ncbi:hypothetical protein Nther_2308 [Natranaerobius thermophilus JW/NM-WN-LF]|uniref:Uncharacterized protein n=1 Tax=Natranaerobius thermophilus (strain ATCC BAA-1301 / DSM 18059 / JW/NM-WN-LF) TaxID=457570 RepID=B2A8J0_NATTJ|nr:hypothetical protein Nther_2308 [Natranaerobius thermophilus JW/NM-WN-LF]
MKIENHHTKLYYDKQQQKATALAVGVYQLIRTNSHN